MGAVPKHSACPHALRTHQSMMLVDSAAENPRILKLISVAVHSARPPMTGTRERLTSSPERDTTQEPGCDQSVWSELWWHPLLSEKLWTFPQIQSQHPSDSLCRRETQQRARTCRRLSPLQARPLGGSEVWAECKPCAPKPTSPSTCDSTSSHLQRQESESIKEGKRSGSAVHCLAWGEGLPRGPTLSSLLLVSF